MAFSVVTLHLGVRAVLTSSMRPDYGPGALLLTERIPTDTIRPGMIVLFVPPGETSEYAHRIVTVSGPKDAPVVTTKGDANKTVDPWHAKLVSPTVSEVIGSVPGVGRLLISVRGTGQILLAVWVACWPPGPVHGGHSVPSDPRVVGPRQAPPDRTGHRPASTRRSVVLTAPQHPRFNAVPSHP